MTLSSRYTRFTASQAVARAKSWTTWTRGYCLNFVWNCLDVPNSAGLEDANQAWTAAQQKVYAGTPPAGAPVYWASGSHGHIAISIGGGWVRSTDWPTLGRIGNVTLHDLERDWGIRYRGWSRDYAGHPISGLQVKPPSTGTGIPAPPKYNFSTAYVLDDEALRLGRRSSSARLFNNRMWSWLYWMGGSAGRSWCTTNYRGWVGEPVDTFGALSQAATRKMYAILNQQQPRGGWGGSLNATYPGPALLRVLGLKAD